MNASDIMVTNVVTAGPDTTIHELADTLLRHRISGIPIVGDSNEILGIVSEGDLMRRIEIGTERRRSWWLEAVTSSEALAYDFAKSHATKASDIMTRNVVTASPDTPVGEIAALLEKNNIKRVPIVKDGKLAGIVTRANLLQALASVAKEKMPESIPSDVDLRKILVAQIKAQAWSKPYLLNVLVSNGNVELWGLVNTPAEKKAIRILVETMSGVRSVNDNLVVWPVITEG